jgi:hypothetical protein
MIISSINSNLNDRLRFISAYLAEDWSKIFRTPSPYSLMPDKLTSGSLKRKSSEKYCGSTLPVTNLEKNEG